MTKECCKICKKTNLIFFAHTAKCSDCGILLYWPYPKSENDCMNLAHESKFDWYSKSSFYNHSNFTNMLRFSMDESFKGRKLEILDYGGGGGQFALVCKSHFPEAKVYVTDINDGSILEEWKPFNIQIPFKNFENDQRKFDVIFLNDVFEHVSDPFSVLKQLSGKLKQGGIIFIDTPKQFWIYPVTKLISKTLYIKVLKGTVSTGHLQIWSRKSFEFIINKCGLSISKYKEVSEYTMPAIFYMKNMKIKNPLLRLAGNLFYRNAKYIARNKILCVLQTL